MKLTQRVNNEMSQLFLTSTLTFVLSVSVKIVFLLGSTGDEKLEEKLEKENQIFGDILQSSGWFKPGLLEHFLQCSTCFKSLPWLEVKVLKNAPQGRKCMCKWHVQ